MSDKADEGAPRELREALDESLAEAAAGLFVSGDDEREARRRSIARAEAERERDARATASLLQAMDEAEAEIDAGQVVSSEVVLGELRQSIARMRARRAVKRASSAS